MVTERRRMVGTVAGLGAAVLAVHWTWLALGFTGGRVLTDLLFLLTPAMSGVACAWAARRTSGAVRVVWAGLVAVNVLWVIGNAIWAWYELVLHETVPVPSPADWTFVAALSVAAILMVNALGKLVDGPKGTVRVIADVLVVGAALAYLVWILASSSSVDTPFTSTVTWLYPALDAAVVTVAFAVMTRVSATQRLPWLALGLSFVAAMVADTVWAYRDLHGGYMTGSLIDPLWVALYFGVGFSAVLLADDAEVKTTRVTPTRWESLANYAPITAAVSTALVLQLRNAISPVMLEIGTALVLVLVLRQVIAILENDSLANGLEQRVADRTSELRASEEHFRSIVQSISDLVVILDENYRIRYQSPAAERLLGYGADEMVGRFASDFAHPDDLSRGERAAERLAFNGFGHSETDRARVLHKDGTFRHMEVGATDLFDHPEVNGIVLAMRDVGDRVALEEQLRHQAFHDSLTQLANRAYLHEELESLLSAGSRPSLLLLDLDEFKAVNDTAGHDLGDDVLVAVGRRLLEATRPDDLVARLGGDEFALVIRDDPSGAAALAIADRVLEGLRRPLVVRGRQVRCLGSIGVATACDASTPADLLRDADVAMYVAKANGKARVELFTSAMREDVLRRRHLEDLVRRSLPERRLVLLFQPVIDLQSEEIVGAEALLRLRGDGNELVSPMEFVPLAEETGLIVEIGAWVLVEACRNAAEWQELRPDGPPLSVSVNVSTRQLNASGLAKSVAAALEVTGLDASLLTLEITEGALADADADAERTLCELRELGVRLSIDDFGAGYSSLGRLRRLPVDELKIDRSFIGELVDGADAPLIDAILAIAQRLGLAVVAEGIETDEQASALRGRQCRRGQGFLYARPLPASELVNALSAPARDRVRRR